MVKVLEVCVVLFVAANLGLVVVVVVVIVGPRNVTATVLLTLSLRWVSWLVGDSVQIHFHVKPNLRLS